MASFSGGDAEGSHGVVIGTKGRVVTEGDDHVVAGSIAHDLGDGGRRWEGFVGWVRGDDLVSDQGWAFLLAPLKAVRGHGVGQFVGDVQRVAVSTRRTAVGAVAGTVAWRHGERWTGIEAAAAGDGKDAQHVGAQVRHDHELAAIVGEDVMRMRYILACRVGSGLVHGELEGLNSGVAIANRQEKVRDARSFTVRRFPLARFDRSDGRKFIRV